MDNREQSNIQHSYENLLQMPARDARQRLHSNGQELKKLHLETFGETVVEPTKQNYSGLYKPNID